MSKQDKAQILVVTDMTEEQKSTSDLMPDRHYRVITVEQPTEDGVISTTRGHKKVIWDQQPMDGPKNHYYHAIVDALKKGRKPRIKGRIETVETEPYYIESENGKFTHPETGERANRVTQKTYVVFEDESVDTMLRNDGLVRKGEGSVEEQAITSQEELVAEEDLGQEEEDAPVS